MKIWEKVEASKGSNGKNYDDTGEFAKSSREYQDESLQTIAYHWGQERLVEMTTKQNRKIIRLLKTICLWNTSDCSPKQKIDRRRKNQWQSN